MKGVDLNMDRREKTQKYFDEIEYAVFHAENEIENYNAFYNEIYCANN